MLLVMENTEVDNQDSLGSRRYIGTFDGNPVGVVRTSSCREVTAAVLSYMYKRYTRDLALPSGHDLDKFSIHGITRLPRGDSMRDNPQIDEDPDVSAYLLSFIRTVQFVMALATDTTGLYSAAPVADIADMMHCSLLVMNARVRQLSERFGIEQPCSLGSDLCSGLSLDRWLSPNKNRQPMGSMVGLPFVYAKYVPVVSMLTYLIRVWDWANNQHVSYNHPLAHYCPVSRLELDEKVKNCGGTVRLTSSADHLFISMAKLFMPVLWHTSYGKEEFWTMLYMAVQAMIDSDLRQNFTESMVRVESNGYISWCHSMFANKCFRDQYVTQRTLTMNKVLHEYGYLGMAYPRAEV